MSPIRQGVLGVECLIHCDVLLTRRTVSTAPMHGQHTERGHLIRPAVVCKVDAVTQNVSSYESTERFAHSSRTLIIILVDNFFGVATHAHLLIGK